MKMFCEACGYIDVAHHDGYGFGDRMLEGVMFEVTVAGTKLVTADVEMSSRRYFNDLNREKWIKAANESLETVLEEAGEGLNCPVDGKEVILLNDDGSDFTPPVRPAPPKKGLKIKVFKGNDIKAYEEFLKD